MKRVLRENRWLHIWLIAAGAAVGLFFALRQQKAWMNALASRGTTPLKQALGRLSAKVPFSVMETLVALLVLAAVVWLVLTLRGLRRGQRRGAVLYRAALVLVCAVVTVYAGFCWLWGVNYYTDTFQDLSGVYARESTVEELHAVTAYFVERLQETAPLVPRNEDGSFGVSWQEILDSSGTVYDAVEKEFPFLDFADQPPKPVFFSYIMSMTSFTGVYCPFAGETNLNVHAPLCLLPSTVAHELAHQRSVASEQECNFLAVLAATTSGDPVYEYSGWLLGYIHLGNALYAADRERWEQVWDGLPADAQNDIRVNNAYWDRFEEKVTAKASQKIYDGFLKSYGDEDGMQSYGTVVDLLMTWYEPLT